MTATSPQALFVSLLSVLLLALGCGGSQGTNTGGQGGREGSSSRASGDSSAPSPSQVAGSSGTAGRGGSASASSGNSAAGSASAGTGGRGGSSAPGGTTGSNGGSGGSNSSGATGGRSASAGRDAGVEVQPGTDASPDAVIDGSASDAAVLSGTNNPVLPGVFADPNIIVFDDTFYLYPTTDGVANWGATSFSVFSSKNLVQWTNHGVILDAKDLTWAKGRTWAPGIARVGDTYYFYFSAEVQLGVATSKSPTGPFKDALGAPLVKTAQYAPQSIDPYVFVEDETRYLLFGSGSNGLRMAKLNPDMISFASTPSNISPSGAGGTLEGVGMFKRKGSYYLYWSEGDTRNASYRMAYARASSVTGPFTRAATLLEQNTTLGILGPGGGTILAIPSRDEHYIAYHRFKIPGGDGTNRETCIDRMVFNSDGTIAPVKPTREGLQTAVEP